MIIFRTLLKWRFSTHTNQINFAFRDRFENQSDSDIDIFDFPKEDVRIVQNESELMTLISQHVDPKVLIDIFNKNRSIFGIQHCQLTIRIIAHFLSSVKIYENEPTFHQGMGEISNFLNSQLDEFSPMDLIELLCFKSKYQLKGQQQLLENIDDQKLANNLNQMLQDSSDFSIRHYINIWYDSQVLNMNLPLINSLVEDRLNTEPLSPMEVVLLIRCEMMKSQKRKFVNSALIEFCISHYDGNSLFYDFQQVTQFYIMLLKVKYQYLNPYLESHPILIKMRQSLIDNLTVMDEHTILSIIANYQLLPVDVPPVLENKIKEFLFKQLSLRPQKISVYLIQQFLINLQSICTPLEVEKLIDEIISKLQSETHLPSLTIANKIAQIILGLCKLNLTINFRSKVTVFSDYVSQVCKLEYSENGLLYLRFICGQEVDCFLTKENAFHHPLHSFAVTTNEKLKQSLNEFLIKKIQENPLKVIHDILNFQYQYQQMFKDLLPTIIMEFMKKAHYQERHLSSLFKLLNDVQSLNLLKDCLSYKKSDLYRLALRQHNLTELQAQIFGSRLIQQVEKFHRHGVLNVMLNSNLAILVGRKNPEVLTTIISIIKQQNDGLETYSFCKYLKDHKVDYRKVLQHSQRRARLEKIEDLYNSQKCVEKRLMLLYILFFN
ncbi:unnamed protein product (macronuclear) [Paramecium tetraurelia]|uniref:Uncharacterized protein n=1 Tax=Paramecium tetraurelia TaxID=5888 RepID=A0DJN9_PARTE|nr:uncharacterized protein GSPATT00017600001 [Paramecium tetraurelia]CAK83256.1 unnamed protein product [Paramecium tetraurelia]|eukprot:XP_001450653.1 hypothetical protein (macronuclear) [Paramecium tetraurelia strain d4-2]